MNKPPAINNIAIVVSHISRDFIRERDLDGMIQRSIITEKAPVILDYFLRHSLIDKKGYGFNDGFRLWMTVLASLSNDFEIEKLHKELLIIKGLSDGAINARGFLEAVDRKESIGLLKMWFEGKKKLKDERRPK